jgi:hypothetical protein
MQRAYDIAIWIVQVICLGIILSSAWVLLERAVFALVAASVVLGVTIYVEHSYPLEHD